MRMRRKKHLDDRLAACRGVMIDMQNRGAFADEPLDDALFFDATRVFGAERPLFLEIGCGKGGYVIEAARRNPDINFVAVEKTANVIVTAAENLIAAGLPNVRLCLGEAEYLTHLFRPHSVDRIILNFSCPFPKKKYAKHRLTHDRFLDIYRQILKPDGVICHKTDNRQLFEFSIERFSANDFLIRNVSLDLHNSPVEGNIMTEYEKRFVELGMPIYSLEALPKRREGADDLEENNGQL